MAYILIGNKPFEETAFDDEEELGVATIRIKNIFLAMTLFI